MLYRSLATFVECAEVRWLSPLALVGFLPGRLVGVHLCGARLLVNGSLHRRKLMCALSLRLMYFTSFVLGHSAVGYRSLEPLKTLPLVSVGLRSGLPLKGSGRKDFNSL